MFDYAGMAHTPRILIAGAGVGGLALAQALRHGGLDVAVYEQDRTPEIRNQGYRIHIDPNGNAALRACPATETLDLVRQTSGVNDDVVAAYTHQLQQVLAQTFPGITDDQITATVEAAGYKAKIRPPHYPSPSRLSRRSAGRGHRRRP